MNLPSGRPGPRSDLPMAAALVRFPEGALLFFFLFGFCFFGRPLVGFGSKKLRMSFFFCSSAESGACLGHDELPRRRGYLFGWQGRHGAQHKAGMRACC